MIGQFVGIYRVLRQIGSGCMGDVWEAINDPIGRRVAIKVLRAEWSHDEDVARRFLNEARATNAVNHPGLVDIYEFGRLADGTLYLVMEYLDGESLWHRLLRRGGRLDYLDCVFTCRQIAAAMAAAHRHGIVHRDLKPANVMLVNDPEMGGLDRVKILDFGVAKLTSPLLPWGSGDCKQTQPGIIMGTPTYMAPEQCRGGGAEINDRTDVYSLGIMLYQMLIGEPPFLYDQSSQPGKILAQHLLEAPRPLRERDPTIPEELACLVHAMLDKSPAQRPSMSEIVVALEQQFGRPTEPVRLPSSFLEEEEGEEDLSLVEIVVEAESTLVSPSLDLGLLPLAGQLDELAKGQPPRSLRVAAAVLAASLCGTALFLLGMQARPHHPGVPQGEQAANPAPAPLALSNLAKDEMASTTTLGTTVRPVDASPRPKEARSSNNQVALLVLTCEEKMRQGDVAGAYGLLKKALGLEPSNPEVLMRLGDAAFELEKWDAAVQYLRRANRQAPGTAIVQERLAGSLYRAGRFREAMDFCRKALLQNPEAGMLRLLLRRAEEAQEKMRTSIPPLRLSSPEDRLERMVSDR